MVYKVKAKGSVSPNAKVLHFDIHILRLDKELFQEVAMFHKRYKITMNDSAIVTDIWRRVENYARVDADRIEKRQIAERAEGIAESLEDRSIEI